MPGANNGTGQPLSFRCSKCRLVDGAHGARSERGWVSRVKLTGRHKAARHGNAGGRNSTQRREYECLDCRHVGWSRHMDLQYLERRRAREAAQ